VTDRPRGSVGGKCAATTRLASRSEATTAVSGMSEDGPTRKSREIRVRACFNGDSGLKRAVTHRASIYEYTL